MARTRGKKGLIQMNFNEEDDSRQTDKGFIPSTTYGISQADQPRQRLDKDSV